MQLKDKLVAYNITVDLVCAYMVIGNIQQHLGIFKGVTDFSCSDPFCANVYWFLMKQVFLIIPGNIIPGIEISCSSIEEGETEEECTERIRRAKIADVEMRIEQIKVDVPQHQADPFTYFFSSDKALMGDNASDGMSQASEFVYPILKILTKDTISII